MRVLTAGHAILVALCTTLVTPARVLASPWGLAPPVEAPASKGDNEAADSFRKGSKAYEMGNYAEAVKLFERSYELSDQADLLFNLGQAYARWYELDPNVDHLRKSRKLYQNYVMRLESDGNLSAQSRTEVEKLIAEVEEQIEAHDTQDQPEAPPPTGKNDDKPLYKKGWFWGTLAAVVVVAGGVTAAVLLTRKKSSSFEPELGTLGVTPPPRPLGFRF